MELTANLLVPTVARRSRRRRCRHCRRYHHHRHAFFRPGLCREFVPVDDDFAF